MINALAIVVAAMSWLVADAQSAEQPYMRIFGEVTDTSGQALCKATIRLIGGTDTAATLSGDDGAFVFPHVRSRQFLLTITMSGYFPFSKEYRIQPGRRLVMVDTVTLRAAFRKLDPAIVTSVRPYSVSPDTISYNVAAFQVPSGSNVEDLLKRLPGVEVDIKENVVVQGKPISKVMVNGKEFFGGDLLTAIQNLPANLVSKLQVIDDYGDKSRLTGIRADEPKKVLNIVFDQDKRNGIFGTGQAGIGNAGKYSGDLFANAFRGDRQISISSTAADNSAVGKDPSLNSSVSYSDQWNSRFTGGLNASFRIDAPQYSSSIAQQTYYPGQVIRQQTISSTTGQNINGGASEIITLRSDTRSTLRITSSFTQGKATQNDVNPSFTSEQDSGFTKEASGLESTRSTTEASTSAAEVYYDKVMAADGFRFSVQGNMHYSNKRQLLNEHSAFTVSSDTSSSQSLVRYLISTPAKDLNLDFHATFYLPTASSSLFEFGYNIESMLSRMNRATEFPDNHTGTLQVIDSLSLPEFYNSIIEQLHAGYSTKLGPVSLSLILDEQPGMLSGTGDSKGDKYAYHFVTSLPQLVATWKPGSGKAITMRYAGICTPPALQQVTPAADLSNPQYPVVGNPGLKESYTHRIQLRYEESKMRHTQFSCFGVQLSYSHSSDPIIPSYTHPKDSSVVIETTTYANGGRASAINATYHFTLPGFCRKRMKITGIGSIVETNSHVLSDRTLEKNQALTWNQALHLQFLIPGVIDAYLEGNYLLSHSVYSTPSVIPGRIQTASLGLRVKHYFGSQWSIGYRINEVFTSQWANLKPTSALLSGMIQKNLLPKNRASVTLNAYNILNNSAGSSESVTGNSTSQTRSTYTGRYFILTFVLKFNHFK